MEKKANEKDEVLNTFEHLQEFNEPLPKGIHPVEVRQRLDVNKNIIISELEKDSNAYHLSYINACGITPEDLKGKIKDSKGCVCDEVLRSWDTTQKIYPYNPSPHIIPDGCIEVYLWGLPGVGKTCFTSTILCVLRALSVNKGSHFEDTEDDIFFTPKCKEFFQMNYGTPVMVLPPSFPHDKIQCFPSSIFVKKGKKTEELQLSIVNVPGDIFDIFRNIIEGNPLKSDYQYVVDQLESYLKSRKNPKYHFFLLNNKPLDDIKMHDLNAAAVYINNEQPFNEKTLGISLIVTKSDQLSPDDRVWKPMAEDIVHSHYYYYFVNVLRNIVGNPRAGGLRLSDGSIPVIPFSMGEVFFQQLCIFNSEPTRRLLEMMKRIMFG